MLDAPVRLLHESLARSARARPDAEAIVCGEDRVPYRALHERALRLARGLQDSGVGRGDRVAVFLENSVDTVAAIYAASAAGAAFMVVNPQTKADKLAYLLRDAGARALIADGHLARVVADAAEDGPSLQLIALRGEPRRPVAGAEDLDALIQAHPPEPRDVGVIPNDLAALIYTSGSTGNPKGVMLSHQNMVFTQGSLVQYLRLGPDDRILNVLPLAFDYGMYQAIMAVHLGATLVLEPSFGFPAQTIRVANAERVTVVPGVPTVFATLLSMHRANRVSLPSVRRYTNTAAHLPDEYVDGLLEMSPHALVFKMYGLTECKRVCYLEPERIRDKPSSVGKAIPGTEAFVLNDRGERAAPGETGVLHVRGPHVMMGYWNLPEATARMLVPGPYPNERILCAHDLFRTDEDGFLYFVGRSDDIIKSRGEKVSPVEVENALAGIPGVREAAIVGVPDEILGQAIRAFVVLDPGVTMSEREFRRACTARLENHMVPRDVVFLNELPKTTSGKVRRKSLTEPAEETYAAHPA